MKRYAHMMFIIFLLLSVQSIVDAGILCGPRWNELPCPDSREITRAPTSPTYGQWGNWQDASCSVTCGNGVKTEKRTRSCYRGSCSYQRQTRQRSCSRTPCKLDYGSACTGDECLSIFSCIKGKCLCADGRYYTVDTCTSTTVLIPTISNVQPSSTSSVTVTWNSTQATGYTNSYVIKYTEEGTALVETSPVPGDVSIHNVTELKAGTSYTFIVVRFIIREGRNQTIVDSLGAFGTSERLDYGSACNGGQCQTILNCITGKCLCADGNYFTAYSCISTTVLIPTISSVQPSSTSSVTITWNSPLADGYNNSYVLKYFEEGTTLEETNSVSGDGSTHTVTGLKAGTSYIFIVVRSITREGRTQTITDSLGVNGASERLDYGSTCSGDQCQSNLNCITGKCLCADGSYYTAYACNTTMALRPTISSTFASSTSSVTITWNSTQATGYTNTYVVKYIERGTTLVESSPVLRDVSTHVVTGLKAGTSYTFVVARSITRQGRTQTVIDSLEVKETSERLGYGSACNEDQCQSIFSCITGKCLCADGSYYTAENCSSTTALRPTISSVQPSSTSSVTVTWNFPLATGYTNSYVIKYTEEGTTTIKTSPVSGDVSTHLVTGLKAGTSYSFLVGRSITREGRTQTIIDSLEVNGTSEKINYAEPCVSNGTCKNLKTDCYSSTCRCNPGYFWNDTTCLPNDYLSLVNINSETLSTTQLMINWTAPAYPEVISGYLVELYPPVSTENIVITGTSATISSLTPGERYSIIVSSRSSYLNRGEITAASAVSEITKPAPTSGLAPATSLTEPAAQIFFYKAEGRVESYTISLKRVDNSIYKTASGSQDILSANFPGVSAGLFYNLTIITNSYGVSSDPFTQMIRVRTEASEAVVDLSVSDVTSRAASLSWKRPNKTKGTLYMYTIEVYNSSTCAQRINIQCTECLREMNVSESFEVNCERENYTVISRSDLKNVNFLVRYDLSLLPATAYDVVVAAYNEEGKGRIDQELVLTAQEAPVDPVEFRYLSKTSESVELRWTPPEPRPGVTTYNLTVYEWDEDWNKYKIFNNTSTLGFYNVSINITGLSSYWKYKFEMYAKTSKGVSNTVDGPEVVTDESAPAAVENLKHQPVVGVYNQHQLSWRCPTKKDGRNGVIRSATVITSSFINIHLQKTQSIDIEPVIGEHHLQNSDCTWSERITVTPEFNYTFEVFISNSMKGESTTIKQYVPPGPPSFVISERPIIEVLSGTETGKGVELLICPTCLLDYANGVIVNSGILVCAKGDCPIGNVDEVKTSRDFDKSPSWDKTTGVSFTTWYRATDDDWLKGKEASDEIRFVLGEENCGVQDQNRFCNGPLPVDRTYRVWPFACTRLSCAEGNYVEFTNAIKDDSLPLPIIGGIVGGAVLVVLAAVFLVVYIKVIRPRPQRQRSTHYVSETSPEDDPYEKIGDGNSLNVIQDCRPEVDYYSKNKDSPPLSENTYDQLKVYSNVGQNDYAKIKDTNA